MIETDTAYHCIINLYKMYLYIINIMQSEVMKSTDITLPRVLSSVNKIIC